MKQEAINWDWIHDLCRQMLIGTPLKEVSLNGNLLILDFAKSCLQMFGPWRIVKDISIFGQSDVEYPQEEIVAIGTSQIPWLLRGSVVTNVEVHRMCQDIDISLSDGCQISVFLDGSKYESWTLQWPGHLIVCSGINSYAYWDNLPPDYGRPIAN